MKTIALNDPAYFKIFIGKRTLREEVYNSTGNIPIYSANVFKPFGFSDSSNIEKFDHVYLLWGVDGKFEFNIKKKGEKFATTDHCGTIEVLDDKIVPDYLLYELRLKSHALGFDRTLRSSLKNMGKVEIEIPTDSFGVFDTKKQTEISQKYELLEKIKSKVADLSDDIDESFVDIGIEGNIKTFEVQEIFDFPETNSGITKEFCIKNKGDIPVYASSKVESSVLGNIKDNLDGVKYYRDSLTWNRNGAVGYFFFRKGKFSTNEDHRVLSLKKEFEGRIDLLCIRYLLETKVKELGYGFTNKLGSGRLSKVQITLPVEADGKPSLTKQSNIRKTYEKIDGIKASLIGNLIGLKAVDVELTRS